MLDFVRFLPKSELDMLSFFRRKSVSRIIDNDCNWFEFIVDAAHICDTRCRLLRVKTHKAPMVLSSTNQLLLCQIFPMLIYTMALLHLFFFSLSFYLNFIKTDSNVFVFFGHHLLFTFTSHRTEVSIFPLQK